MSEREGNTNIETEETTIPIKESGFPLLETLGAKSRKLLEKAAMNRSVGITFRENVTFSCPFDEDKG
jgi:hypothetical protein